MDLERLVREKLGGDLFSASQSYDRFKRELSHAIDYRVETIHLLNKIADDFDNRRRDVNIARVTGSSVAIVGAAATAVGAAVLTLCTGGVGLAVVIPGAVALAAGTLTSTGSSVVEKVMETSDLDLVQRAMDVDREQCEKIQHIWKDFESYCFNINKAISYANPSHGIFAELAADIGHLILFVIRVIKEAFEGKKRTCESLDSQYLIDKFLQLALATVSGASIVEVGVKAVTFISKESVSLTVILGMLSIVDIIKTSIDIHKGSLTDVAHDLREQAKKLQHELEEWWEL